MTAPIAAKEMSKADSAITQLVTCGAILPYELLAIFIFRNILSIEEWRVISHANSIDECNTDHVRQEAERERQRRQER